MRTKGFWAWVGPIAVGVLSLRLAAYILVWLDVPRGIVAIVLSLALAIAVIWIASRVFVRPPRGSARSNRDVPRSHDRRD